MDNIRLPQERYGDIVAQLGNPRRGPSCLSEFIDRIGLDRYTTLCDELGEYARRVATARFSQLPAGRYEATAWLDDDGVDHEPLRIQCALTVSEGRLRFDFAGTSARCRGPMNSPPGASQSGVLIGLLHLFPELVINAGTFSCLDVEIPEGTFLHATYPSPVAGCASEVPARVIDVVMSLLGQASPDLAQGAACSTSANLTVSGMHEGREFIMYFFAAATTAAIPARTA